MVLFVVKVNITQKNVEFLVIIRYAFDKHAETVNGFLLLPTYEFI